MTSPLVVGRATIIAFVAAGLAALGGAPAADARPYAVVSCDAAAAYGSSSEAWVPARTAGSAYATCPSAGNSIWGISNRITGVTVPGFSYSTHAFTAPPGTTITGLRWSGRLARESCGWGAMLRAQPSARLLLGTDSNTQCSQTALDLGGQAISLVPPPGTTALQQIVACGLASCGPGAAIHTRSATVTVEDPTSPAVTASGALVSGRWVGGRQPVSVHATDNTGIANAEATLGPGRTSQAWQCNYARTRPCADRVLAGELATGGLPQGRNELVTGATDAAGNTSYARYPVYVDNEPPARVSVTVQGGEGWRRSNGFAVAWQNPPQTFAPVLRVRYRRCGGGSCSEGQVDGRGVESLERVLVPGQGEHTLEVWLEDEAGNHSLALGGSEPVRLRLDQEAPDIAFEPQDQADPLRVAVRVADRLSGVDTGEIELRPRGGGAWHSLPAARDGGRLVGYVDDDRFRAGAYELRARVRDLAGNERSTDRRVSGARATIDLPARSATQLQVGVARTRGRGRHRRTELVPKARARHGTRLKLSGRLTAADGGPIGGATVDVSSDSPGDAVGLLPAGLARTDRNGRFTYAIRAGANKLLRFRYAGSRRIRAATGDFALAVPAASSIRATPARLRNGESVRLSGVVRTGPLPPFGKLVEVQAYFRGRFRTFSTTRADASGRWTFDYRFGGTRGRVPYRLRALLPAEGGYPFVTGRSRVARVVVTGP